MCFLVTVSPPYAIKYVPSVLELSYVPFAALKFEDEYLI
jgi:hypothetical protein